MDLGARTVWTVFIRSFNAATYDIKEDKRGVLFQRLIDHGPPNPDDPEMQFGDAGTTLSNPNLGLMHSCSRVEIPEKGGRWMDMMLDCLGCHSNEQHSYVVEGWTAQDGTHRKGPMREVQA